MTKDDLRQLLLSKGTFTIAEVQRETGASYGEIRECVRSLTDEGRLSFYEGLTFGPPTAEHPAQAKSSAVRTDRDDDMDEADRRRKALMERLAAMADDEDDDEEDDSDDEDTEDEDTEDEDESDDDDDLDEEEDDEESDEDDGSEEGDEDSDDEEGDWDAEEDCYDDSMSPDIDYDEFFSYDYNAYDEEKYLSSISDEERKLFDEARNALYVRDVDYAAYTNAEEQIEKRLVLSLVFAELRSIQFGPDAARYVLYTRERYSHNDVETCLVGFRDSIKNPNVQARKLGAKWSFVIVPLAKPLDALTKRAILFWLRDNGGVADVVALQRGLGVGYGRATLILSGLQALNCVERVHPEDGAGTEKRVLLNEAEIEMLFPASMGWE